MFFFEKKNQKTFALAGFGMNAPMPQEQKFFCFAAGQAFFSKKEALAFN
jgi:hypothetical protein